MLKHFRRVQLAEENEREARAALDEARATLAKATDALRTCAKKHSLDPDDVPAMKRHAEFLDTRDDCDQELTFAQLPLEDAWEWIKDTDFDAFDGTCHNTDTCWFSGNLDRRGEFAGYWQCVFDESVVLCDVCYGNMCQDDLNLIANEHRPESSIPNILESEANQLPFDVETIGQTLARAAAPDGHDQWRQMDELRLPCIVQCGDVHNECHILVGKPRVVLCAMHHADRTQPRVVDSIRATLAAQ